jgi:hypothetical protein
MKSLPVGKQKKEPALPAEMMIRGQARFFRFKGYPIGGISGLLEESLEMPRTRIA